VKSEDKSEEISGEISKAEPASSPRVEIKDTKLPGLDSCPRGRKVLRKDYKELSRTEWNQFVSAVQGAYFEMHLFVLLFSSPMLTFLCFICI
jgi:hypothetical protein